MAAFVLLTLTKPAFAYIGPGSGTMILQAIVLAFVGGWFAFKNYWLRIFNMLRGGFKRDKDLAETSETERDS